MNLTYRRETTDSILTVKRAAKEWNDDVTIYCNIVYLQYLCKFIIIIIVVGIVLCYTILLSCVIFRAIRLRHKIRTYIIIVQSVQLVRVSFSPPAPPSLCSVIQNGLYHVFFLHTRFQRRYIIINVIVYNLFLTNFAVQYTVFFF